MRPSILLAALLLGGSAPYLTPGGWFLYILMSAFSGALLLGSIVFSKATKQHPQKGGLKFEYFYLRGTKYQNSNIKENVLLLGFQILAAFILGISVGVLLLVRFA